VPAAQVFDLHSRIDLPQETQICASVNRFFIVRPFPYRSDSKPTRYSFVRGRRRNHRPGATLSAGSQTVLPTVRSSPATTVSFSTAANRRPTKGLDPSSRRLPAQDDVGQR
jgi:hypothetical protein